MWKRPLEEKMLSHQKFYKSSVYWILGGILMISLVYFLKMEAEVYIIGVGLVAFGLLLVLTGYLTKKKRTENGLVVVINDLFRMPKTMAQLAFVQFFSWFALFSMWIYTTAGVTSTKYDMMLDKQVYSTLSSYADSLEAFPLTRELARYESMYSYEKKALQPVIDSLNEIPLSKELKKLNGVKSDLEIIGKKFEEGKEVVATIRVVNFFTNKEINKLVNLNKETTEKLIHIEKEYNEGADWVGILMAVYNGFAAVMAFLLIGLARITSRKTVHFISLIIGGISLISFLPIMNPRLLLISELGIGLAWASILAMPYAILTGSLPAHKMGTYMGIFNFFIVIPQIMAASILGFFVKSLFNGESIYALVAGGVSMIIAALLVLIVNNVDEIKK